MGFDYVTGSCSSRRRRCAPKSARWARPSLQSRDVINRSIVAVLDEPPLLGREGARYEVKN